MSIVFVVALIDYCSKQEVYLLNFLLQASNCDTGFVENGESISRDH